jgi:hypothetical protein
MGDSKSFEVNHDERGCASSKFLMMQVNHDHAKAIDSGEAR